MLSENNAHIAEMILQMRDLLTKLKHGKYFKKA